MSDIKVKSSRENIKPKSFVCCILETNVINLFLEVYDKELLE